MTIACGQGKVGAVKVRAKMKVVTQPKPKKKSKAALPPCHEQPEPKKRKKKGKKSKEVLVMRQGEEKVEVWRVYTKFTPGGTRSYAQGFTKGLLVMAPRSRRLFPNSRFALARIVKADLTRDHHWVVKFVGDAEDFDRTMGFRHLKVEKRYRVQKSAEGDKNGYRNELKYPREWVAPVLIMEGQSKGGLRSLFP